MRWAAAFALLVACGGDQSANTGIAPGEIIGRVDVSPDVPAASCRVFLEGTPIGARCDETGEFDLRKVPPGRWDIRIVTDDAASALPARRLAAGSNPGQVTDLGAVALARPGSIGGIVKSINGKDLSLAIVAVPEIGAVTAPNANGGYLLDQVSPGNHEVILLSDAGTVIHAPAIVQPAKITVGIDLDLGQLVTRTASVTGRALRAGSPDGQHAGITVELVESLDGAAIDHTQSAADGTFKLAGKSGTYVVRARDGDNPAACIVPSVVLNGRDDLSLSSPLSIAKKNGDLDGDGIPDASDPDIDGDGFANEMDAFPYDPAEWLDTDKDGVGDRSDLRSMGGKGIDHKVPTPDTDGDGVLDFADNCPTCSNADQKDIDGDGVGDACDNCPRVPNPDQRDSLMTKKGDGCGQNAGVGDACRACARNEDCGPGKLCQFGTCVGCIDNAQCGDRVCDKSTGTCVACGVGADCTAPMRCDLALGRCVECLDKTDCQAKNACVNQHCRPQCTDDTNCPNQFCVNGGCVACRGNADCTVKGDWCDGGTCRVQCVNDSDCDAGRSCDAMTHTCFAPCNGMCMNGQTCNMGKCLAACDGSVPCKMGFKCQAGACVPECAVDKDCAGVRPFTFCSAGQCVPNGKCGLDADCAASQMCASGVCAARPTMLVQGKGYTCAGACDCRQGETCAMGFCVADAAPTRFAAKGGMGAGTDQTMPGDLSAILAAVQPGERIALAGGDSFGPAAFAISQSKVSLVGGYKLCAANRWVRDPSLRSTLHGATQAVLAVSGSKGTVLDGVTVQNVDLIMDDWHNANYALNATYAPHLTLSNMMATVAAPPPGDATSASYAAFSCVNCDSLSGSDLSMPGADFGGNATLDFVYLASGSGTLARLHAGAVQVGAYAGIDVAKTTGPVTINAAQIDGFDGGHGGAGIRVTSGAGGTVTVSGAQVGFGTYLLPGSGNDQWDPIALKSCPDISVTNNIVEGRGLDETGHGGRWSQHYGMWIEDSNGTVAMNTVYLPIGQTSTELGAYRVLGPAGNITFTGNVAKSGTAVDKLLLFYATAISAGTLNLSKCDLSGDHTTNFSWGLAIYNVASAVVTDTVIHTGTAGSDAYGLDMRASAGRVERSRFYTGAAGNTGWGAYVEASQLELYDSFLFAGAGTGTNYGLQNRQSQLFAAADTLDGGGVLNGGSSIGYGCLIGAVSILTSNLISGGTSPSHWNIVENGNAGDCAPGITCHNDYFWYAGQRGPAGGDLTSTFAVNGATPDQNGNIDGGAVGCYDTVGFTPPDYHIAANSPCIDKGAPKALRKDGTTIDKDIDGNARSLGKAPDIGCAEKM